LILGETSDGWKAAPAVLKLEIARNMMYEGDYRGCLSYIDQAMRALRAND